MPVVPIYERAQVAPEAPRNVRTANSFTPADGAQAAGDISRLGQQLDRSGEAVFRMREKARAEINKTAYDEAVNQALVYATMLEHGGTDDNGAEESGYQTLRGARAVQATRDGKPLALAYTERFHAKLEKLGEQMGNDDLRQMWREGSLDLATRFQSRAMQYEGEQVSVWRKQTREGKIASSVNGIAVDPFNKGLVAGFANRIRDAAAEEARDAGLTGEAYDVGFRAVVSKAHMAVVEALAGRDPIAARAYLMSRKEDFNAADYEAQVNRISNAAGAAMAEQAANELWAAMGPKTSQDPVKYADMLAAGREKFKDDPATLKHLDQALKDKASAWDYQQREITAAATNQVFDALSSGRSLTSVMTTPAWQSLPGKERSDIIEWKRNQEYQAGVRADAAEARNERRLARENGLLFYQLTDFTQPGNVRQLSEAQIMAMRPTLGVETVKTLLDAKRRDAAAQSGVKDTVRVTDDDFKAIAQELGFQPYKSNLSEAEKSRMGALRLGLENGLTEMQRAKGRPLTREEALAAMRAEGARTILVQPDGMFNSYRTTPAAIGPAQLANVVVPPKDRAQIIAMMQERAKTAPAADRWQYAATEENIKRWYVMAQSPLARENLEDEQ